MSWKKKNKISFIVLAIAIAVSLLILFGKNYFSEEMEKNPHTFSGDGNNRVKNILKAKYYDPSLFKEAVEKSEKNPAVFPSCELAGGIIPHHLAVSYLISDYFGQAAKQNIQNVIIVGPNHFEKGARLISSSSRWETPFGIADASAKYFSELEKSKIIEIDEEVMVEEFSASSIIPFVKYYLPEAKVLPLIVRRKIDDSDLDKITDILSELAKDEKTILVSAVDFSHYLNIEEADEKDKETLRFVENFDVDSIRNLSNDYMDSPSSVIIELMAMRKAGFSKVELVEKLNSGRLEGQSKTNTTSYFSFLFCR